MLRASFTEAGVSPLASTERQASGSCSSVMGRFSRAGGAGVFLGGGATATFGGLMRRDRMVLDAARTVGVPVAIVIAGGYGRDVADTVRVHANTARVAAEYC